MSPPNPKTTHRILDAVLHGTHKGEPINGPVLVKLLKTYYGHSMEEIKSFLVDVVLNVDNLPSYQELITDDKHHNHCWILDAIEGSEDDQSTVETHVTQWIDQVDSDLTMKIMYVSGYTLVQDGWCDDPYDDYSAIKVGPQIKYEWTNEAGLKSYQIHDVKCGGPLKCKMCKDPAIIRITNKSADKTSEKYRQYLCGECGLEQQDMHLKPRILRAVQ